MESQKKNALNLATGNRAEHIQSYLDFELGLRLSLQLLCKLPLSELSAFKFKVLIAQRVPIESQGKKNLFNLAAGNRAYHIQSYLSS